MDDNTIHDWVADYLVRQKAALDAIDHAQIDRLVEKLRDTLANERQLFVCGNGGSAATASHFVTDLGKGASDRLHKRFRCVSLNDNTAWITALGNDYHYDDIFVRQLHNFARPGDVLLVMSVSGDSPNVVKAAQWCKANKIFTIALVGAKRGRLASIADEVLAVESEHYGRVEDTHMTVCHLLCYAFMENAHLAK